MPKKSPTNSPSKKVMDKKFQKKLPKWSFRCKDEEKAALKKLVPNKVTNEDWENQLTSCEGLKRKYKKPFGKASDNTLELLPPIYKLFLMSCWFSQHKAVIKNLADEYNCQITKASHPLNTMIRIFLIKDSPKRAHAYANALRYALANKVTPDELEKFLEHNGKIYKCSKYFSDLKERKHPPKPIHVCLDLKFGPNSKKELFKILKSHIQKEGLTEPFSIKLNVEKKRDKTLFVKSINNID